LADEVGLDVFAVENITGPTMSSLSTRFLGAAGAVTKKDKVVERRHCSQSDDPVRVYQQFATIDLISGGRAEIMAGRGRSSNRFHCLATT